MTAKQTGGPAYPTNQYANGISPTGHSQGMTLRDYFAAKALQGMLAGEGGNAISYDELTEWAYATADAMLKARAK